MQKNSFLGSAELYWAIILELDNLTRMSFSRRHFMLVAESPAVFWCAATSTANRSSLLNPNPTSEVEGSRTPRAKR